MNRRQFIESALAGGGMVAFAGLGAGGSTEKVKPSNNSDLPNSVLGRTGARVSLLGLGCAPLGQDRVSIGDASQVLHRSVELGVNYVDTAPNYGNAEEKMGSVIREIRDKIFLVTKTEEPSYEETWRLLRQSMERLQTDHIDMIHLHNFGLEKRFPDLDYVFSDKGALGALREAKKQGVIRFIGASGHLHPTRFHTAIDTGEIYVLMKAVNFVAQHTYDFEHKVWLRARQENIGLVAMKVLGGAGKGSEGFRLPEEHYGQAIRYALSIPGLSCAVIGIENIAELEKAVETVIKSKPLSQEEAHELSLTGLKLAGDPKWQSVYGKPLT